MFGGKPSAKPKKGAKKGAAIETPKIPIVSAFFTKENWVYQLVDTLRKLPAAEGKFDNK